MLAFIGFIAVALFCKFLYDTYVTGKTDKQWDTYKRQEPEKAARMMTSSPLSMNTDVKRNPIHQQESLHMLAGVFNCEVSEVREVYKAIHRELLTTGRGTLRQAKQAMAQLKPQKYDQAVKTGFDPEDTPAGFMERWHQELINEFE